jgi:hypothetical protein
VRGRERDSKSRALTGWKAPSRIHEQLIHAASHRHSTAKWPNHIIFRNVELLSVQVTNFPLFAHNQTVSYLQSSLSNNCVILVRKFHNCIMNGSTPSSIINLYMYINIIFPKQAYDCNSKIYGKKTMPPHHLLITAHTVYYA